MPKHLIQGCPYRKPCPAVLMVRATEDRCSPRIGIKEMRQPARWSGGYGASFFSGRSEIGKEELEEWRKLLGR